MDIMEPIKTLKISVIDGQRTRCDSSWAHGGNIDYFDPFGRLYYIKSGRGEVVHSGKLFELRPGSLFVIPAHVKGRYRCPRAMDLFWVHFDASVYSCLDPFALFGWSHVAKIPKGFAAEYLMETAIQGCRAGNAEGLTASGGALRLMLSLFVGSETGNNRMSAGMWRFIPVFDFINSRLGERITLRELAEVAHLQPNYFSNRFVEIAGIPPMQFINRRRVEEVSTHLRFSEKTLSELAGQFGFSDAFHLSKVFKRFTGVSPQAYRSMWAKRSKTAQN